MVVERLTMLQRYAEDIANEECEKVSSCRKSCLPFWPCYDALKQPKTSKDAENISERRRHNRLF